MVAITSLMYLTTSRSMLMDIEVLQWSPFTCAFFDIPMTILPEIHSSSEIYGNIASGPLTGIPICGCLADENATLLGQLCFNGGQAKNTYSTGSVLLYNTGRQQVFSRGLLTTVAFQLGAEAPPSYALEGSVAMPSARWLRDNFNIIESSQQIAELAANVETTQEIYFVPVFQDVYMPYWQGDTEGILYGLTESSNKAQIVRAIIEAIYFQIKEIVQIMNEDSGQSLKELQVDGGMSINNLLMQCQANILEVPVIRQAMQNITALGAAIAAGAALGINISNPENRSSTITMFTPTTTENEQLIKYDKWKYIEECNMRCNSYHGSHSHRFQQMLNSLPAGLFMISSFLLLVIAAYKMKLSP